MEMTIKQQNEINKAHVGTEEVMHSAKASCNTDYLAAGLAKDWAIKTDGTVNDKEYSAKHYAFMARDYVKTVMSPASANKLGMIKVGDNLSISDDGTLSADTYSVEEVDDLLSEKANLSDIPANVSELNNDSNFVTQTELTNQFENYISPLVPATCTVLGGIKIGAGINVDPDGTISADLDEKLNKDFTNMSPSLSAKEEITNWITPDFSAGVLVSEQYFTAPKNGVLLVSNTGGNGKPDIGVWINDIQITTLVWYAQTFLFLSEGDVASFSGYSNRAVRFYPLKGVNDD